jgi:hypothetical protein
MLVQDDGQRLTKRGYERLRRATRTHREELVLRLCAEAGLRAGEIARLRPSDVTGEGSETSVQYYVAVREADGGSRTAYLPAGVAHDFWQYVRSNSIDTAEEVIGVTERRVQMLVREVCERAAEETGRAALGSVTPSTLRQFFAQQLLVRDGVDARVVAAVGGWEGIDSLLAPLSAPSKEEIGAAFEHSGSDGTDPGRFSRVVDAVERAVEALLDANSRDEIEQGVCEGLVAGPYAAAWFLTRDRQRDRVVVRTHAGESADRFDGAADTGVVRRSLQTGQSFVAPDDPGPASQQEGRGLLGAVPVGHGETQYGALVVRDGSPDAFDDPERTLLHTLGRQTGFAVTAVERRQVLAGGAVLEVRFQYSDSRAALVGLADRLGCTITLDGAVAGSEGFLCFVRVSGVPAKDALEAAAEIPGIGKTRLIRSDDDGGLLEVALADRSPLLTLTERGATITELRIEDGQAVLTSELAPETDLRAVHDELHDRFPSVELRSKQETRATTETPESRQSLEAELTEKQRAVLRTAYHAGYFEWPRGSTAEDLAESMGVSSPTLHNHLRRAQQTLLERILDGE